MIHFESDSEEAAPRPSRRTHRPVSDPAARFGSAPSPSAMESELSFPWPIDLGLTVASHGWVHLEPWRWEGETGTLLHTDLISGRIGTIAVQQSDPRTLAV